jgi:hypothetical protein
LGELRNIDLKRREEESLPRPVFLSPRAQSGATYATIRIALLTVWQLTPYLPTARFHQRRLPLLRIQTKTPSEYQGNFDFYVREWLTALSLFALQIQLGRNQAVTTLFLGGSMHGGSISVLAVPSP